MAVTNPTGAAGRLALRSEFKRHVARLLDEGGALERQPALRAIDLDRFA